MDATATLLPSGIVMPLEDITNEDWVLNERGGLSSLTFDCVLTDAERADLVYGTPVSVPRADAAPLIGRVLSAGNPTITCGGGQSLFDDILGGATYSVSQLAAWEEWTSNVAGKDSDIIATIEATQLKAQWTKGTAYTIWNGNGWVLPLAGPTDKAYVSFAWQRYDSGLFYQISTGVPGTDEADPWTWTVFNEQVYGSGGTIGTVTDMLVTGTQFSAIRIVLMNNVSHTPTITIFMSIKSPRVKTLLTVNPSTIAADLFTRAGIAFQDVATTTDDLTDIEWEFSERGTVLATDLLDRGDWLMRIEARPDVTGYKLCGVLEPRPATADEVLYCDGVTVIENIESIGAQLTGVRVTYTTASGLPSYVNVLSANPPSVPRWDVVACDTTSAATATAFGTAFLAMKSSGVRGTVTVKGRTDFVEGHRLTFTHTRLGTVTARVRQINGKPSECTLALDDTDTFEAWEARGGVPVAQAKSPTTGTTALRRIHAMARRRRR